MDAGATSLSVEAIDSLQLQLESDQTTTRSMLQKLRSAVERAEARLRGIPSADQLAQATSLEKRLQVLSEKQTALESELKANPTAAMHVFGKEDATTQLSDEIESTLKKAKKSAEELAETAAGMDAEFQGIKAKGKAAKSQLGDHDKEVEGQIETMRAHFGKLERRAPDMRKLRENVSRLWLTLHVVVDLEKCRMM